MKLWFIMPICPLFSDRILLELLLILGCQRNLRSVQLEETTTYNGCDSWFFDYTVQWRSKCS